jgi:membrane protein YdbS with pleckstrin-like domain
MQRLHPSVRITWLIDTAITTVFMFGGMTAIDLFGLRKWDAYPLPPMVGAVLMLIAWIGLMIYYNIRRYACWGYAIRPLDVLIEQGVWWKSRRCIPRSRIQHVDIRSGPIDRSLGLANVSLFVAGGVGAVAEIAGVDPLEAERLRSALVDQDSAVSPVAITPPVPTAAPMHQAQAPMHQIQQTQGWQGGHEY